VPVEEELDTELEFPGIPVFGIKHRVPRTPDIDAICSACAVLYPVLFKLLLGMENALQIEVDVAEATRASSLLRNSLRSPKARATFAAIDGVLSAYSATEVDTIEFSHRVQETERARLFEQLLADQDYRRMSHAGYQLGISNPASGATRAFGESARRILALPAWTDLLQRASRTLRSWSGLDLRESRSSGPDLSNIYLPPIFPAEVVRRRAQKSWLEVGPKALISGRQEESIQVDERWIIGEFDSRRKTGST